MPKWKEFGDQVNRLVYAIAGKNNWPIEIANRYVADHAHYSEDSIRSMRQGTFRPQAFQSLEAMVEIGSQEVELGRSWAILLLRKGGHPDPDPVLEKYYPQDNTAETPVESAQAIAPFSFFAVRVIWVAAGSILFLLIWVFFFNPAYPASHELVNGLELIWGLLIGAGLAIGLALADQVQCKPRPRLLDRTWSHYVSLFVGGLFGAFLWISIRAIFFRTEPGASLQSTGWETFIFGAAYTAGFLVMILLWTAPFKGKFVRPRQAMLVFGMTVCGGLFALAGLLLARSQPAFLNQNDIDLFVGLALRVGLILILSIAFTPWALPRFYHSTWLSWLPWLQPPISPKPESTSVPIIK